MVTNGFANMVAPKTGKRGQEIPIVLTLVGGNSCYINPQAWANVDETTKTVTFEGSLSVINAVCLDAITYRQAGTTFTPEGTGTYHLKVEVWPSFDSGAGSYDHLGIQRDPEAFGGDPKPIVVDWVIEVTE